MHARMFLAATGQGVTRARRSKHGTWYIERLLINQDVRCLVADPRNQRTVYAGTQGSGVLCSGDGGATWEPFGLQGKIIKSLAVSRAAPGIVYAGTKPASVFVARHGAWTELESFRRIRSRRFWFSPAEPPFIAYVQGLAVSPTDPNIILAGIEAGAVVRSSDGGQTWSGHRRGALRDCHSLIFHATDGKWAYEGGGTGAGAAVSRDAGARWAQQKAGMDRHYGWAIAADAAYPEVAYVSVSTSPWKAHSAGNANAYIYRSTAGGPWQKLGGGLPQPLDSMPYALVTDPAASGHIYAGLSNGDVWHSSTYGDSWQRLPLNLGAIRQLVMWCS